MSLSAVVKAVFVIVPAVLAMALTVIVLLAYGNRLPMVQVKLPPAKLQPLPLMVLKTTPAG